MTEPTMVLAPLYQSLIKKMAQAWMQPDLREVFSQLRLSLILYDFWLRHIDKTLARTNNIYIEDL